MGLARGTEHSQRSSKTSSKILLLDDVSHTLRGVSTIRRKNAVSSLEFYFVISSLSAEGKMRLLRFVIMLVSMSCASFGQTARDVAKTAFKSVVLLEMNDANGQPLSLGSGFFVADGVIATNAHVIEGAFSGTAKLIGSSQKAQILGSITVDRYADLALLKVGTKAPSLPLGPSANPTVGDNVYVVGNPLGLEGTFSEGIISGVRSIGADSILQMTAPISPGSSGGPVMDSTGAVIGVSVATFQDGQNLNLAVPVSYLSRLLSSATTQVLTPLAQQGKAALPEKSMLAGVGARAEAGVVISDFQMDYYGDYTFRLSNRLPEAVTDIKIRIIYYDNSGALMDFEDYNYWGSIPPGLTKTLTRSDCSSDCKSEESRRAATYYHDNRKVEGDSWEHSYDPIDTKHIELRVVSFIAERSQ